MKKILVIFYSRTGFTRKIAEEIVKACNCDIEEIQDIRSRKGFFGFIRSIFEARKKKLPAIKEMITDPTQYDLVILGTPVWAKNISTPLRTYVAEHRDQFKSVAFFCTMGSSGAEKVLHDIAQLCGRDPVVSLSLTDKEIKAQGHKEKVHSFVKAIV